MSFIWKTLRFVIFLLLAPLFAALTLLIVVTSPDLFLWRRHREDLRYFWTNLWGFVTGEEAS